MINASNRDWRYFGVIVSFLLSIAGLIVSGGQQGWFIALLLLALSALIALTVARWIDYRSSTFSPPKILARARDVTVEDMPAIHAIAKRAFAPNFGITEDQRLAWHEAFPEGNRILRAFGSNKIIGFYTLLPLKKAAADRMRSGETLTTDIQQIDVCRPARATALHIAGVVCEGTKYESGLLLFDMANRIRDILEHYPNIRYITAQSINATSQHLLENHGFTLIPSWRCESSGRRLYLASNGDTRPNKR